MTQIRVMDDDADLARQVLDRLLAAVEREGSGLRAGGWGFLCLIKKDGPPAPRGREGSSQVSPGRAVPDSTDAWPCESPAP